MQNRNCLDLQGIMKSFYFIIHFKNWSFSSNHLNEKWQFRQIWHHKIYRSNNINPNKFAWFFGYATNSPSLFFRLGNQKNGKQMVRSSTSSWNDIYVMLNPNHHRNASQYPLVSLPMFMTIISLSLADLSRLFRTLTIPWYSITWDNYSIGV